MLAEINYWSVTFSSCHDSDDLLLCRLLLTAREHGFRFGSVNVASQLAPRRPDNPPVPPYVWFPRFDEKDALALLELAGISLDEVTLRIVPFETPQRGKSMIPELPNAESGICQEPA